MWWGRRYLPMVVPTLLVLVGVAAGLLWERRGSAQTLVRIGTAVVVLVLGAYMLRQSTDLWGHEEFGGSLEVIDQLDAVADGEDVAFVWYPGSTQVTNFAMTPFTWLGLPGLTGSPRPTPEGLLALQRALGGRPALPRQRRRRAPAGHRLGPRGGSPHRHRAGRVRAQLRVPAPQEPAHPRRPHRLAPGRLSDGRYCRDRERARLRRLRLRQPLLRGAGRLHPPPGPGPGAALRPVV